MTWLLDITRDDQRQTVLITADSAQAAEQALWAEDDTITIWSVEAAQ